MSAAALVPRGAGAQESEIRALLDRHAAAIVEGDRAGFVDTLHGAPRSFVAERTRWFARMQRLPIRIYELEPTEGTFADLSDALVAPTDDVIVVPTTRRLAYGRFDAEPSADVAILTIARTDGRWGIVADDDLEDLGLFTDRDPADFAEVDALIEGDVLVLHHGEGGDASQIAAGVGDAIERVEDRWPISWPGRVVVQIPRTTEELAEIFHTTVDLSPFVAFAGSSSEWTDEEGLRRGGVRIYIQPSTYRRQPVSGRANILAHEMVHAAAASRTGPFVPSWLEEGVAQVYGEIGGSTSTLDEAIRSGRSRGRLPYDHEFFLGDERSIGESYDAARSFATYLGSRFGSDASARYLVALGSITPDSIGTARYHRDHVLRITFGVGFERSERAWLRSIGARAA